MTRRKRPDVLAALRERAANSEQLSVETNVASQESLHVADVMISDWSGAALEYAFALERPVLFVDVPRKINNPEYEKLELKPLEVSVRERIGEVIAAGAWTQLVPALERLCDAPEAMRARIREAREASIYNVGSSGQVGAEAIAALADAQGDPT